jgi:hypothetical protein
VGAVYKKADHPNKKFEFFIDANTFSNQKTELNITLLIDFITGYTSNQFSKVTLSDFKPEHAFERMKSPRYSN